MKIFRIALIASLLPLLFAFTAHKFYVSITKIEFAEEEQSIQIITKIFIDDVEDVLQERYNTSISLNTKKETPKDGEYLKEYILDKLNVEVNGAPVTLNYIGHEYDIDVVKSFIEISNVSELKSIEVENKMMMELFEEQQNIIHIKRYKKRKTLVLDVDNPKGLLNFN